MDKSNEKRPMFASEQKQDQMRTLQQLEMQNMQEEEQQENIRTFYNDTARRHEKSLRDTQKKFNQDYYMEVILDKKSEEVSQNYEKLIKELEEKHRQS